MALFANAEVAEYHVQNVLDIDPAGEAAERPGRKPQLFGQQVLLGRNIGALRPPQRRQGLLKRMAVALPGHQRRLGAGEEACRLALQLVQ